jgi:hypothetical protein
MLAREDLAVFVGACGYFLARFYLYSSPQEMTLTRNSNRGRPVSEIKAGRPGLHRKKLGVSCLSDARSPHPCIAKASSKYLYRLSGRRDRADSSERAAEPLDREEAGLSCLSLAVRPIELGGALEYGGNWIGLGEGGKPVELCDRSKFPRKLSMLRRLGSASFVLVVELSFLSPA